MMNEPINFDTDTYVQVANLLGDMRAHSLMLMLRSLVGELNAAGDAAPLDPAGLVSIHRLKSEAGLMGFTRLSQACAAFDDVGPDRPPSPGAIRKFRSALTDALSITDGLVASGDDAMLPR